MELVTLIILIIVLTVLNAPSIEIHLIVTNSYGKIIAIIPTLQMSKLRLTEVEHLARVMWPVVGLTGT